MQGLILLGHQRVKNNSVYSKSECFWIHARLWEIGVYKKYTALLKSGERLEQPKIKDTCWVVLTTVHSCLFLRPHHSWIHGEIFKIYNPKMKEAICFLSTQPSMGEWSHSCCDVGTASIKGHVIICEEEGRREEKYVGKIKISVRHPCRPCKWVEKNRPLRGQCFNRGLRSTKDLKRTTEHLSPLTNSVRDLKSLLLSWKTCILVHLNAWKV